MKKHTGLCFAADLDNYDSLVKLLPSIIDYVDVIKINYPLVLTEGISVIKKVKENFSKPIIADFKVSDVEVTNQRIIQIAAQAGADAIMVHGFIGTEALVKVKQLADSLDVKIILVTQLTNRGGEEFGQDLADEFALLARKLKLFAVQAPGTRLQTVQRIRSIVGPDIKIFTCGIGVQGGKVGGAIRVGADYEIIGRLIYNSLDPKNEVKNIVNQLLKNDY